MKPIFVLVAVFLLLFSTISTAQMSCENAAAGITYHANRGDLVMRGAIIASDKTQEATFSLDYRYYYNVHIQSGKSEYVSVSVMQDGKEIYANTFNASFSQFSLAPKTDGRGKILFDMKEGGCTYFCITRRKKSQYTAAGKAQAKNRLIQSAFDSSAYAKSTFRGVSRFGITEEEIFVMPKAFYTYEMPLSQKNMWTVQLQGGVGLRLTPNNTLVKTRTCVEANIEPRYYFDLKRRYYNKRRTDLYGANYWAFPIKTMYFVAPKYAEPLQILFAPKWGMQRYIGKPSASGNMYYNFQIGPGFYLLEDPEKKTTPYRNFIIDITFELGFAKAHVKR